MGDDLDEMPDFPPNPPGYGEVVGGVVLYDSTPTVIEAACAAHWANDWETMSERMRIDQRRRMKDAIRAAINTTCARAPSPTSEP